MAALVLVSSGLAYGGAIALSPGETLRVSCEDRSQPVVTASQGAGFTAYCGGGSGGGVPGGTTGVCQLKRENSYYNVYLNNALYGQFWTDENGAIAKLQQLREAGLCGTVPALSCVLKRENSYYNLYVGTELYQQFWTDEAGALTKVKVLRAAGACF